MGICVCVLLLFLLLLLLLLLFVCLFLSKAYFHCETSSYKNLQFDIFWFTLLKSDFLYPSVLLTEVIYSGSHC